MKAKWMLRMVVAVCFSTILSGIVHAQTEPVKNVDPHALRFAVIGDRTGTHVVGVYGQIAREIQRLKPDLVLSVGDLIEGYTDDRAVVEKQWLDYKNLIELLTMPIHFAPGNHDIWNPMSLQLYKRFIGEPYYSFDVGDAHFIVLDTSRSLAFDDFPENQIEWLKDDLKEHQDASHAFVILHVPYWIDTIAKGESNSLHDIFVEYGIDAVFTGHHHEYFSGAYDGILYTGVGSSGGGISETLADFRFQFVWVTVDGQDISIAPIEMGSVFAWDEVTASEYNFASTARLSAIDISKALVEETLTVADSNVEVSITNLSTSPIDDMLRWEMPKGWIVTPKELPVKVAPLGKYVASFRVECVGDLYPVPTLRTMYPISEKKKFTLEKRLPIARRATAIKAEQAPIIDGVVDENIWSNPITKLLAPNGGSVDIEPAHFFFAWDESNLYLGAKCIENDIESIAADATERDGPVYAEDCVGFFFQPDVPDGPIYQIYFNPLGVCFDQKLIVTQEKGIEPKREWNGNYDVRTYRGEDHWSIEIRIPFAELDAQVQEGATWGLNFRRKQKRLNSSADWQVPVTYEPDSLGNLLFE